MTRIVFSKVSARFSGTSRTYARQPTSGRGAAVLSCAARLTNFAGLAPAYIEVGELDIFRDESIAYALGLARAGVPIELHVHPGAPHGFERFVPDADVARRAMADRVRAVASI